MFIVMFSYILERMLAAAYLAEIAFQICCHCTAHKYWKNGLA